MGGDEEFGSLKEISKLLVISERLYLITVYF